MRALPRRGALDRAQDPAQEENGFSLVELLVVVMLLGVVGSVAVTGIVRGMDTSRHAQSRADALSETQIVVERVSRELRAADRLHDVDPSRVDVEVVRRDRRIRFVYEVEGDELRERREELVGEDAEEEDFDLTSDPEPPRTLLTGLEDPDLFIPQGGDGRTLDFDDGDQLSDVRRIRMTVARRIEALEAADIQVTTMVWPRNTKTFDGDV